MNTIKYLNVFWLFLILFLIINIIYLEINNLNNYEKIIKLNTQLVNENNMIMIAQLKNNVYCHIDIKNTNMMNQYVNDFNNGVNYFTLLKNKNICNLPVRYEQLIFDKFYLYVIFNILLVLNILLAYYIFYMLKIEIYEKNTNDKLNYIIQNV